MTWACICYQSYKCYRVLRAKLYDDPDAEYKNDDIYDRKVRKFVSSWEEMDEELEPWKLTLRKFFRYYNERALREIRAVYHAAAAAGRLILHDIELAGRIRKCSSVGSDRLTVVHNVHLHLAGKRAERSLTWIPYHPQWKFSEANQHGSVASRSSEQARESAKNSIDAPQRLLQRKDKSKKISLYSKHPAPLHVLYVLCSSEKNNDKCRQTHPPAGLPEFQADIQQLLFGLIRLRLELSC